jgi:DsbC/DsbD-like thiol-disulfide interchange protein
VIAFALLCALAAPTSRHVQAQLVSEVESIRPGEPFWVGLHLRMAPRWHTYWKNPGDSGLATRLKWTLPAGVQAGEIQWPYPRVFTQGPVTSYGYEGEVLLPVKITPAPSVAAGEVALAARADWLECEQTCIPGRADLSLTLPVRAAATPSPAWAAAFAEARRRLPAEPTGWRFEALDGGERVVLVVRPPRAHAPPSEARFFPDAPLVIDHAAPQALSRAVGFWRLLMVPAPNARRPLGTLSGVLVIGGAGGQNEAVRVEAPTSDTRTPESGWREAPSAQENEP